MKEYCFDSGHHDDLEQVCNIDLSFVNCLNTTSPVMLAAKNIFSDKVNNPLRTALDIDSTLRCLYISICSVYELHAMQMQRDLVLPEDSKELFFKKEEIIHILNRIVNTAIMNFCIIFDNTFRGKIKLDCIGSIENNKKVSAELKERIKEHINWVEFKPLFKTINDLNNALKHHILYEESASYYCKETPIYRVLFVPGNDLSLNLHSKCNSKKK